MSPPAPRHPYRVTRRLAGPLLSEPQTQVLTALVHLCSAPGSDTTAQAISRAAGLRHGSTVVILRSLTAKGFVACFEEAEPARWTPTLPGRARARQAAAFGRSADRRVLAEGVAPMRPGGARATGARPGS